MLQGKECLLVWVGVVWSISQLIYVYLSLSLSLSLIHTYMYTPLSSCFLSILSAYSEVESVNPMLRAQLRAMIQRLDPDTVATAAAAGDSTMLREFLAKRPGEV